MFRTFSASSGAVPERIKPMAAKALQSNDAAGARRFSALRRRVGSAIDAVQREAAAYRRQINAALAAQRRSAANLAHYIGLRKHNVRQLQLDLAGLGLSSLGRSEGHVHDTLLQLEGWLTTTRHAVTPR